MDLEQMTHFQVCVIARKQEQALIDRDLVLMEQTELADLCRKQAEKLEVENLEWRAELRRRPKQRSVYDWLHLVETKIGTPTAASAARVLKEFYEGAEPDDVPAIPVQAGMPAVTIKQLAAQKFSDENWTAAEQNAFAPFLAQFPNEGSQGIQSLGSAWKHGIAYAQSLAAAPQQHAQAAQFSGEVVELAAALEQEWLAKTIAELRAIKFREGSFQDGYETALDEIEMRCTHDAGEPWQVPDCSVTGNAQAAGRTLVCPNCKTDRLKEPCPKTVHECPMLGNAQAAQDGDKQVPQFAEVDEPLSTEDRQRLYSESVAKLKAAEANFRVTGNAQAALSDAAKETVSWIRWFLRNVNDLTDFRWIRMKEAADHIEALAAAPAIQQEADDLTEEKWRVKCWESIRQHHMLPDGIEQRIKTSVLAIQQEGAALDSLSSVNNLYADPIEDIAHALADELEEADLNSADLVTVNREKLILIAERVLQKARVALAAPLQPQPAQGDALSNLKRWSPYMRGREGNEHASMTPDADGEYILRADAIRALNKQEPTS